ncbi:MAG: class I SAM-dependent methyltransferase [Tepidisphaeraceae bacterium]
MENASDLFDQYAGGYEAALDEGLKVTGENPAYFAEGRVKWMQRWLDRLEVTPRRILDFGCGTGGSVPFLLKLKGVEEIVGVDVSDASLNVARERYADPRVQFHRPSDFSVEGSIDLAFCNGVFHHIPPADRPACVRYIHTTLRPGGLFALWENNPWNPGVRYIMSRVSFDRDAIMLSPPETKHLITSSGFQRIACNYCFVFPKQLSAMRPLERLLRGIPIGGQFLTLGRRMQSKATFDQ